MAKKAVIVLPTFNERENIANFIDAVFEEEKKLKDWSFVILVVDSNSPDGTADIVEKISEKNSKVKLLKVGPGLGVALMEGHMYSQKHLAPDAMVQLDADGQVDPAVIGRLLQGIEEGYDLVIGSRFVKGGGNRLPIHRRVFSMGAGWVCRIVMGPLDIQEYTNSARAFTPELFGKIDLDKIPWRIKSFIIQPAFLHQAVRVGAKYKEVPLIFKNRAEGYSKNKIINYIYDILTYAVDVRLNEWGIRIPVFSFSHKAKTPIKFGLVGVTGTLIDFCFYNLFISYVGLGPATAKGFSTEIAIVNNFLLNNIWTFRNRKTSTSVWQRFGMFNVVSFGGLMLGVLIVKWLHEVYGDGFVSFYGLKVAYYNLYFFATVPPVMIWNFTVNHLVTWRNKK
jgi:dolichol-phosphate mannosyltransferase